MMRVMLAVVCILACRAGAPAQGITGRVPAVPLIPHDPYFSIWSSADSLFSDWPRHWTGKTHGMAALLRVDGRPFRLMGRSPRETPPALQAGRRLTPTRTDYEFTAGGVRCTLSFLSPQLPWDADLLSWPVSYVGWTLRSDDGASHRVEVYLDIAGEVAVNSPDQNVTWGRYALSGSNVLRIGSQEQPVLAKRGDDLRIDWGFLYLAVPEGTEYSTVAAGHATARSAFIAGGSLPAADDLRAPRPAGDDWPVLACSQHWTAVGGAPVRGGAILLYDDIFGIQYLHRDLPAYWRRNGMTTADLLLKAGRDRPKIEEACAQFDREFLEDARAAGGPDYQDIATLAYRQCLAANKIVADIDGSMLMFPKENFSNGCIGTVDVIYPASPMFLFFHPALLKAQVKPLLEYAELPRWKFPFAPHDLGTYPHANGQVYGGGEGTEEDQMPVEESGNMLLMVAGIAEAEGSAAFALQHWALLQRWAEYLKAKGFDPENQLCTDDFAGHLAHNVNLSAKAILALGAYARLCEMGGKSDDARTYRRTAEQFAGEWVKQAADNGHTRLAFDRPGTWSQKYNLVWDRILRLGLFPPEVARQEIRFGLTMQNPYGLPLDNRQDYTKLDWIIWTASLAENEMDFRAFVAPVARFLRETPDRVPLTDWYWTTTGKKAGFQARSVVGGVFVKMLLDRRTTARWRSRAGR